MTNPNHGAFASASPDTEKYDAWNQEGLTKREYFAATVDPCYDTGGINLELAEFVMGTELPKGVLNVNWKWWIKADAKYRVMLSDALIEALNETP